MHFNPPQSNPASASSSPPRMQTSRPRFATRLFPSLLFLLAASGCFQNKPLEVSGGGGIETTDGEIVASAGMAQGVRVRMVPEAFNPLSAETFPDSLTAVTDAAGRYAFKHLPPGRYNLEAYQPKDGTRMFRPGLVLAPAETRTLPTTELKRTGKLRLLWEGTHRGYLFIPGTSLLHRILTAEIEAPDLVLDSLPDGMLPPVNWSQEKTDTAGSAITDTLLIRPDSISEWTVFAAFAHQGSWHLNTTASGAGVAGDVSAFPVLVRLSAPEFDFTQAAGDGRDIRFSDPDGKDLPYQVERWDSAAGLAEIWVRLPEVEGDRDREAFRMHWGNPRADSHSSGRAVFGADNHFLAVLHLGESGDTAAGTFADATGSGRNGTGVALDAAAGLAGAVGRAQNLDGATQWIRVAGTFPTGTAPRSLSAWGKSASPSLRGHLVDYGTGANLASFGIVNDLGAWTAWHWGDSNDIATTGIADTAWRHLAMDYDGSTTRFYLDGILVGSAVRNLATTATGFTIGCSYAGDFPWPGLVDEVEMSSASRSPDWIKLSFELQKPESKALRLEILE